MLAQRANLSIKTTQLMMNVMLKRKKVAFGTYGMTLMESLPMVSRSFIGRGGIAVVLGLGGDLNGMVVLRKSVIGVVMLAK